MLEIEVGDSNEVCCAKTLLNLVEWMQASPVARLEIQPPDLNEAAVYANEVLSVRED